MEITCDQCGTVFSVDPDTLSLGSREVVCPGCFQFHALPDPEPNGSPGMLPPETPVPSLGEGGLADRLRDGFTLTFDVRHPTWDDVRHLNPYEIQQCIYHGEFDGQEEYREKAGRWFPIGENPSFALTFQLAGLPLARREDKKLDPAQRKFVGWKSGRRRQPQQTPTAPQRQGDETAEITPHPASSMKRWAVMAGAALVMLAFIAVVIWL